ncbi:MAG: hypothetical protein IPH08_04550 [Rhodocyclaceae bacterium]|nr:hypothetical protein [Rhodocyclaceae bacterium]
MALTLQEKWFKYVHGPVPTIDPGKSCAQYYSEGLTGVPEANVWCVIDNGAQGLRLSYEEAAAQLLRQILLSKGVSKTRQAYHRKDPGSPYITICRVIGLTVLRENNDDDFATEMDVVDRQVQRLLATPQQRGARDLLANFPDLGLDIGANAMFAETLSPRVAGLLAIDGMIDEYACLHDGDFTNAARSFLRRALGPEGFAHARKALLTGDWKERIRYQCRVMAVVVLRELKPQANGFRLAQVDLTVQELLMTDGERRQAKRRVPEPYGGKERSHTAEMLSR